jgi:hypothetical protein
MEGETVSSDDVTDTYEVIAEYSATRLSPWKWGCIRVTPDGKRYHDYTDVPANHDYNRRTFVVARNISSRKRAREVGVAFIRSKID